MLERAVGPDQPPRPPGDLNTYLPDPPERLPRPSAPLRTRTRRPPRSPARNWKSYYPIASADAALKQRRRGGRVGPGPHPLRAEQGPPGPLRPDSPCAHEQRRLPWFLPGRNFLIPFFGLGGCQAPGELSSRRVSRTQWRRDFPLPTLPPFASVGAAGNARAPSSLNICLLSLHLSRTEDWEKQPVARWPCPLGCRDWTWGGSRCSRSVS